MRRVGVVSASVLAFLALLGAAPVSAAQFIVTFDETNAITNKNDFRGQLSGLGLRRYANFGATLSLSGPAIITFHDLGSESGFANRFTGGSVTALEQDGNRFLNPIALGSDMFGPGSLQGKLFFTTRGNGHVSQIGSEGFGIFLPRRVSGEYRSATLYFGFDDLVKNDDDNHDDFIVKATISPIPEPATWAMMLLGFGLIGLSARRSRAAPAA